MARKHLLGIRLSESMNWAVFMLPPSGIRDRCDDLRALKHVPNRVSVRERLVEQFLYGFLRNSLIFLPKV